MSTSTDAEVVVNIEAELAFWQFAYQSSAFHRPDFGFDQYVASLKFAYDAYLRFHERTLDTVLPQLQGKYQQAIPTNQQLDWDRAVQLIRSVWDRLRRSGARNRELRAGESIYRPVTHRCSSKAFG